MKSNVHMKTDANLKPGGVSGPAASLAAASPAGADRAARVTALHASLGALRGDLLRFAAVQLRDRDGAEDVVQEALAAALAGAAGFDGRSTAKTWVFGILRFKIIDRLRSARRSVNVGSLSDDGDHTRTWERLFDERGHWTDAATPAAWREPDAALRDGEFYAVFEACLEQLPDTAARAFAMRELLGLSTQEICSSLAITSNHFHVLMHRARLVLRECIDARWFSIGAAGC